MARQEQSGLLRLDADFHIETTKEVPDTGVATQPFLALEIQSGVKTPHSTRFGRFKDAALRRQARASAPCGLFRGGIFFLGFRGTDPSAGWSPRPYYGPAWEISFASPRRNWNGALFTTSSTSEENR